MQEGLTNHNSTRKLDMTLGIQLHCRLRQHGEPWLFKVVADFTMLTHPKKHSIRLCTLDKLKLKMKDIACFQKPSEDSESITAGCPRGACRKTLYRTQSGIGRPSILSLSGLWFSSLRHDFSTPLVLCCRRLNIPPLGYVQTVQELYLKRISLFLSIILGDTPFGYPCSSLGIFVGYLRRSVTHSLASSL